MDENTRQYWLNIYRQWRRMTEAELKKLNGSESDPLADQVKRRLTTLIGIYDAAIQELERDDA
jgi:uncharacterized alpha-E superfamily protein